MVLEQVARTKPSAPENDKSASHQNEKTLEAMVTCCYHVLVSFKIDFFCFIKVRPGDLIEHVLKPKDSFVYPTLREMPISKPSFNDDFIRLIVETKNHFEFSPNVKKLIGNFIVKLSSI